MALPTLKVVDADGATQTPNTLPPSGQATSANSLPVVIASDQSMVPTGTPSGVASDNFTRPADTTSYAMGDLIANTTVAGSVAPLQFSIARVNGGALWIRRVRLRAPGPGFVGCPVRVHFFQSAPTFAVGDNGVFQGNVSEAGYAGYCDVTAEIPFSGNVAKGSAAPVGGDILFQAGAGKILYAALESRYAGIGTTSGGAITVEVEYIQVT